MDPAEILTGPAEPFLKWGAEQDKEELELSERSERSVNRRGVQGPAVGPLLPLEAQWFCTSAYN